MIDRTQLTAFRTQAQAQFEELFPVTITIDGADFAGASVGPRAQGAAFGQGGEIIDRLMKVRINKALFGSAPAVHTIVYHGDVAYKISAVADNTTDPAYTIDLEPVIRSIN